MSHTLNIEVDIFAGHDVKDACHEMMALAEKLGIVVMSKCNGVRLMALPGEGDGDTLYENWNTAMKSKVLHPHASSRKG